MRTNETMKSLRFGIELEVIGKTREQVALAIAPVVGGQAVGSAFGTWEVADRTGRPWKVVRDGSLSGGEQSAEIVSPILTYEDLAALQDVVRAVRKAGAKVDASCGIHVHVDASRFDAKAIVNLAKLVHQQEDLIVTALGIAANRLTRYTKKVDERFVRALEQQRPRTLDEVNIAWYGQRMRRPEHYHATRYHGLNLHSIWNHGTIEFRYFNSSLHAGAVKAYVQFCLALAAKGLVARTARLRKRSFDPATTKYDFRVFLLRLGLIGEEFKTARLHLLAHLHGSAAWKHTRPPVTPAAAAPAADRQAEPPAPSERETSIG